VGPPPVVQRERFPDPGLEIPLDAALECIETQIANLAALRCGQVVANLWLQGKPGERGLGILEDPRIEAGSPPLIDPSIHVHLTGLLGRMTMAQCFQPAAKADGNHTVAPQAVSSGVISEFPRSSESHL